MYAEVVKFIQFGFLQVVILAGQSDVCATGMGIPRHIRLSTALRNAGYTQLIIGVNNILVKWLVSQEKC